MLTSILLLIFLSFCIGTGVWLFFLYSVKKGEFDDIEGPKYRMLDDEDDNQQRTDDERNIP
ncbi:MAG: cbb3-type cytochrome oxidase assembly protein CcoS [Desulfuromonadales bacterium]|jgi:cbb3-type cytochrome oxidase maturation protein|nr:cbb3-type cytochrome oxidase assembly protein CcoS [Desulfuromonadales bacterium]